MRLYSRQRRERRRPSRLHSVGEAAKDETSGKPVEPTTLPCSRRIPVQRSGARRLRGPSKGRPTVSPFRVVCVVRGSFGLVTAKPARQAVTHG